MDDDKLYIPYGLSIDQEYFPGFGGRELRQFFVGILGSGIIGALLLIFTGQLLAMIVALMIGAAGTMMAVRKDPYTRISVVGQISDIIHFHKSQKALSSVDFDRDMILKNIYMATDHVGILSYNIRENANTYAVVSQERIDDLYMQLRQQSDTDIIVDCTSDISQSKLTAKAVITADVVIELLTCDTNGLVFDGSQEPILQSEQYTYRKFVRMMSLSSVFKQDEAAMKNAMGRISGTIPYCPKAAEYLNQGTLLTKGVDDRTYNTTIKSLAEIIMKEE